MATTASPAVDSVVNTREAGKARILILEDEKPIREIIARILAKGGYGSVAASDAAEARAVIQQQSFELVLADINLPGESGLSFARWVQRKYPDTALMMVTGVGDIDIAEDALNQGIYGYITKPFNPTDLLIRISGALKRREQEIASRTKSEDMKGEICRKTEELAQFSTRLKKAMDGIIHAMALAIESRDPYTAGHQQRVGELATAIAAKMGLENERIEALRMAGIVHDLGKISVPAEILSKPTRLSAPEYELIKTHSETGYKILKEIDFEWPIAEIVYQHHERIDGSGYPLGLKGEGLLLEAKIIAVADVVEAMASHRPYRPALGIDMSLAELAKNRGRLYDADVVDACLILFRVDGYDLPEAL